MVVWYVYYLRSKQICTNWLVEHDGWRSCMFTRRKCSEVDKPFIISYYSVCRKKLNSKVCIELRDNMLLIPAESIQQELKANVQV